MGQHCLLVVLVTAIFRKYSRCSKTSNTFHFLFTNKILAIRTGIYKTHARIANGEDKKVQTNSADPDHLIRVCAVCLDLFVAN